METLCSESTFLPCFIVVRIEDRRLELESENARLTHSNMLSMSDRARMKAHVQSLTLLNANKTSSSAVKPLEAALSQTESGKTFVYLYPALEKKQLLETVRELEAKIHALISDPYYVSVPSFASLDTAGKDEIVDCLKIQLNQLTTECNALRKEMRTASMLKLSETDKLRHVEMLLRCDSLV